MVIDGTMIVEEYLARKVSEGTAPPMAWNPLSGERIVLATDWHEREWENSFRREAFFSLPLLNYGLGNLWWEHARSPLFLYPPLSKKEAFFLPLVSFHAVASIIASVQRLYASGRGRGRVQ